ncbi:glycosyltransferase [Marmoricola endophyticus]|uniref:glycosyltransferase n=1 Tax=Marmoricola endophyticus TaxID=2040280 RepID=UPI00166376D3|nr:glycosyltransferase [Marmoricola endophyticus]
MPAETDERPRIVAVSVTFDRRELVTRLVRAVTAGSVVPDEIVVVDNASRDDTVAALEALAGELDVPLRVVRLASNTGGAGGFHAGLVDFLAGDADLVWLMDDDGVPAPDCLELLLPRVTSGALDFAGPVVVAEDAPERLCFPIRLPGGTRVARDVAGVEAASTDGVVGGVVIPFNGVLLTRDLVQRIGTVEERFFIWGDDVEYLWRAERDGARVGTVAAARFAHPATDDLGTPMAFGRTTYNHSPSDLKHYCMCRNNVANLRTYRGLPWVAAFAAKTVWFYLFTRPDLRRLRMSLAAMHDGFWGRWGRHERYLR